MIELSPRPTIEQRLDALGVPRSPRAQVLPGLQFGPDLAPDELVEVVCANCGHRDRWWLWPARGVIICRCTLRSLMEAPL